MTKQKARTKQEVRAMVDARQALHEKRNALQKEMLDFARDFSDPDNQAAWDGFKQESDRIEAELSRLPSPSWDEIVASRS